MQEKVIQLHPAEDWPSAGDEELMQRYALGDIAAFEELFTRHKNSVYAFIRGFITTEENADDLFQNVFIRLINARKKYKPSAKFSTWLFTITRSVCIDELRKKRRGKLVPLDPPTSDIERENPIMTIPCDTDDPRDQAYESEIQSAMKEIIAGLPEQQKEVLLLREKTDLTFQDIAKITGCSANTVKGRMHYALLALRQGLTERGYELR